MSNTKYFYRDLKAHESLEVVLDGVEPVDIPDEWWIVVADVLGSTEAIERGEYKSVNTVGASVIVSLVNIDRDIPIPYMFGGDGATAAVPPEFEHKARCALLGVQELSAEGFGLTLRTGMVLAGELRKTGNWVQVAKYNLSKDIAQPAFLGRGWEYAEEILKKPVEGAPITVLPGQDLIADADFTGFECRWKGIEARRDHKLSLLIQYTLPREERAKAYNQFWQTVRTIYGDEEEFHPIAKEQMKLGFSWKNLFAETMVRTKLGSLGERIAYYFKLAGRLIIGKILVDREIDTDAVKWSEYKNDLVANTDYRKYDGTLKMVLDGTEAQMEKLKDFLDGEEKVGRLHYGMHTSKSALLTCLIFDHNKDHIHFLDGGDGGYAIAAKQLKQKLKAKYRAEA